mgnify:CR=1 FL=1
MASATSRTRRGVGARPVRAAPRNARANPAREKATRAKSVHAQLRSVVTSREVALMAGVSRSAVSRTFTPDASVSEAMRRKVMAAATTLGYEPNVLARSLITDRSRLIGLVMAEWENPFYTTMLSKLSEKLQRRDYQLMLLTAAPDGNVDGAVRRLLQYRAEGILLVSCTPDPALARSCVRDGTRMVIVNRESSSIPAVNVSTDNVQIGRDVARLLIDRGYRRLGVVRGNPAVSISIVRTEAFKATVAASGKARIVLDETGVVGYDAGRRLASAALQRKPRPDAIFCYSDLTALGVLDGARLDLNIAVPDELAVVGNGDVPAASWAPYDLTTVRLPIDALIDASIEALLAEKSPDPRQPIIVEAGIVERSTVRRR